MNGEREGHGEHVHDFWGSKGHFLVSRRWLRYDVAESLPQLAEPGFEIAPLVYAVRKQRAAHLLRTRRLHHTPGFVEAQALLFKGQAAVFQQFAHLAFQIRHQQFIADAVDAPGQHAVVVRHQLNIAAVEAADVTQAVREPDTGLKMLLEVRETAGQRRTPRIDDAGVGQYQVNQADVQEIGRHFVDEIRSAAQPVGPGLVQVALPQRFEFRPRQARNSLREFRRPAAHLKNSELQSESWN